MHFNYKTALVTGGLGFIGSHLVEKLIKNHIKIIIVDNKSTNVVDEKYFKDKNCSVIIESISKVNWSKIKKIDVVFHLASILGPTGVLKHGGDIAAITLSDTVIMRDFCLKRHIPLIDISTSEVYGYSGRLKENSKKIFPAEYQIRTEYGAGKMCSEMAIINKAKLNDSLKYHIIRPFNVSGPRQKPDGGFVLPRFVVAALTSQTLTVYGDGSQQRAFTHVNDICDAILAITKSNLFNNIWNIGNPQNKMSIKEMAQMVIDTTKQILPNNKQKMVFIDPHKLHGANFSEVQDKIPYIKKIKTLVGWNPKISSQQIVNDTIDYYLNKIKQGYYFKVT